MKFINKAGVAWYLHSKQNMLPRNKAKVTTYYFKREKAENYCEELPIHLTVSETHTGLPVVKRR